MDIIINQDGSIPSNMQESLPSYSTPELNLLSCCGYDMNHPPLADLLKKLHNLKGDWIILSPIHWEASHNDAIIVSAADNLSTSEEELRQLFQWYSDFLAEDNGTLVYHNAVTWLLRVDDKPTFHTRPLYQMVHQSMMPELSKLDSTMYWQKFFTESQMFFSSTINKTEVNGVWFWGDGKLNDTLNIPIVTDEHYLGLAGSISKSVTLYNPSVSLEKCKILLLNQLDTVAPLHKDELTKKAVSWYWNKTAYRNKRSSWFKRIWRY